MSKLVIVVEKNKIMTSNIRLQPLVTWLHFMNLITIAVLCLLFLKIYKAILLLYEWLFPFKQGFENPTILVIGPRNSLTEEIVFQLSKKFNSKTVDLQDINDNTPQLPKAKRKLKQSQLLYSSTPIVSQEIIKDLSKYIQKNFGLVDILVIAQNEEPTKNLSTQSFLHHLNKQLLAQFWTVMAFLPGMLRRNSGYIISVALGKSSLTNTGIMRTIHEELLQCDTKVKLTLIESNTVLGDYLPPLSSDILARLIIRSMWNFDSVVKVPSLPSYVLMMPILILRAFAKIINLTSNISF